MFARPSRTIVAQYERPEGLSLIACAELLGDSKRAVAAQLVDFAVRRIVSIAQVPGAKRLGKTGFTLVLNRNPELDAAGAARAVVTDQAADEYAVLRVLFGHDLTPGSRIDIAPGRNRQLGSDLKRPHREAVGRLAGAGLVRVRSFAERVVLFWRLQPTEPTGRAAASVDHLWGVRDYIAWAEKDRLAFLQSPRGAERRLTPLGDLEVLKLHEKLLPFAMLFGLERQWIAELDVRYSELGAQLAGTTDLLDIAGLGIETLSAVGDLTQLVGLADLANFSELGDLGSVGELGNVGDLGTIADFADAAGSIGAIFGGLAEFLDGLS